MVLEGLDKGTQPDRLVVGIDTVAADEALLAPGLTRRLIEQHLTPPDPCGDPRAAAGPDRARARGARPHARGLSNDAIAAAPVVSGATVKTHVDSGARQLVLRGRVQAVVLAYETELVQPGS